MNGNFKSFFSDTVPGDFLSIIKDRTPLVIKSHQPTEELADLVRFVGGRIILSVRDPRDCVASLMEAFDYEKNAAILAVKDCAVALHALLNDDSVLAVQYEHSIGRAETVANIANAIGISAKAEDITNIANSLDRDVVRASISGWVADGIIDSSTPAESWTENSHWHPNHVGDGRTGKYSDFLTDLDVAIVERSTMKFIERFGYGAAPSLSFSDDRKLSSASEIVLLGTNGISFPEDWGVWTDGDQASFEVHFNKRVKKVRMNILFFFGPSLKHQDTPATGELFINENSVFSIDETTRECTDVWVAHNCEIEKTPSIKIVFSFTGLRTPEELGINLDQRKLGVGIRSISWTIVEQEASPSCAKADLAIKA